MRYVHDAKEKGSIPIDLSPIPGNIWTADGRVARASRGYGLWTREVGKTQVIEFINMNELVARRYEALGQDWVGRDFCTAADHDCTAEPMARLNAAYVVEELEASTNPTIVGSIVARHRISDHRTGRVYPGSASGARGGATLPIPSFFV